MPQLTPERDSQQWKAKGMMITNDVLHSVIANDEYEDFVMIMTSLCW